jgi:hypothetical protein
LRTLVESIVNSKDPNPLNGSQAQFLATWDVGFLAQRLREALPHQEIPASSPEQAAGGPVWTQFTRGLSPNLLGAFLLIGLAASACTSSNTNPSNGYMGDAGASGGAGGAGGISTGGARSTGGHSALGGAGYTCQRDAGNVAGASSNLIADAGNPLPASCCYDTASELWDTIDGSSLSASANRPRMNSVPKRLYRWHAISPGLAVKTYT